MQLHIWPILLTTVIAPNNFFEPKEPMVEWFNKIYL